MPAATRKRPAKQPEEPKAEVVEVTDPEEVALLTNARKLREAAQNPPEPGEAVVAPQPEQTILLEDERSQRELDLRAINQQILGARQALAAAKINRLLNEKGMLNEADKQHDRVFRQDIGEIRQMVDFFIALKAEMGPIGVDEPKVSALETATLADLPAVTG